MLAWGCPCGRLCSPGDAFCAACGKPRAQGEPIRDEAEKRAFLRRAEVEDGRALQGVRRVLRNGEKSYRATADELYAHAVGDYAKFGGWFGEWLRGTGGSDPYGGGSDGNGYGIEDDDFDDFDEFD